MKTMIYTLVLSGLLMSCTGGSGEQSASNDSQQQAEAAIQNDLLSSYMSLKDALVASDASAARAAAKELATTLGKRQASDDLLAATKQISNLTDLKAQRAAFETLTEELITLVKAEGTADPVYLQHCPMALGNKGASWLSMSEEIRNPYFGDMMLTCGSVKDQI